VAETFVLQTAGMRAVTVLRDLDYHGGDPTLKMEVYRPVGVGPWPMVLFMDSEEANPAALEGRARLVASVGLVGVVFTPRSWDRLRHVARKVADVEAAFRFVRARAHSWGGDADRLAVWASSSGVPVGVSVGAREDVACAVAAYGAMDVRPYGDDPRLAEVSPMAMVESGEGALLPPMLLVRCGQDDEKLNESIDAFCNAAWEQDLPVELLAFEDGHHGFEVVDHAAADEARQVLRQIVEFLQEHLGVG
jgi:dienelactone hydrolase